MGNDKKATAGPPKDAPTKFKMTGAYTRTNLALTLTWDYPKSATDNKSANRWAGTVIHLSLDKNLASNTTSKTTLKVGETGRTKWKTEKKKKKTKKVLYKVGNDGKLNGKYKGDVATVKTVSVTGGTTKKDTEIVFNKRLATGTKKKTHKVDVSLTNYNPSKANVFLDAVICKIQGYNKFSLTAALAKKLDKKTLKDGDVKFNNKIPWALYQVNLAKPSTPVVEMNYVEEERKVNFKCVATQPGEGKHWYRTDWEFKATRYYQDPNTKKNSFSDGNVFKLTGSFDKLADNKTYSLGRNDLTNMNTKIEVSFKAKASGAHGDSDWSKLQTWTFAYPHQKRIDSVDINGDLVVIKFSNETTTADNTNRYTHRVWLERLPDFMIPERLLLTADNDVWISQAARASGWEKVGGEFDPAVEKFVRSHSLDRAGLSSPYSRTLYRIGAKNDSFNLDEYYVYSTPGFLPGYATIPKPSNDAIDFLECVPEKNGTSVRIVLAYQVHYEGEYPTSDGCQVSWSDDYNSWRSNDPPPTFDMPDLDNLGVEYFRMKKPENVSPVSDDMYNYWLIPDSWEASKKTEKYEALTGSGTGQRAFNYTSKAYIMGLSEGVKYYFRARRYLEESTDLPRLYGPYADYSSNLGYEDASDTAKLVKPSTIPENVKLKVSSPVPVGKDLELVWTFEGDGTQTEWELKRYTASEVVEGTPDTSSGTETKTWKLSDTAVGVSVKSSKDAAGYTLLPYDTTYNDDGSVKELGISEYLEDNLVYFVVGTKTTGDFGYSTPVQVQYVEPPSASLGVPPVIQSQPMSISIGTNINGCSAAVKITALDSVTRQVPNGLHTQPSGYVVYSKKYDASELHWKTYNGPVAPSAQSSSGWFDTPPDYDEKYPEYYRSYQYEESGTTKWTTPELDKPLSELKLLGASASDPVLLWYAGPEGSTPSVPVPVDTEQAGYSSANPSSLGWCEKQGLEDNRYYVVSTDTEVSNAHVYYEMCGPNSVSTSSGTWTTQIPQYDSENPVYYYCYRYKVSAYDAQDCYAWTEVGIDEGMGQLMSGSLYSLNTVALWNCESALGYFSNLMLPRPLELLDAARYEVSLVLEDPSTKLDSKVPDTDGIDRPLTANFSVEYARSASPPSGSHVLVFSAQKSLTTTIQILRPQLHVAGDLYDVYRVTPDGITQIGSDISPGQLVQDVYAPFSSDRSSYSNPEEKAVNLRYRVVVRTPDGTEAWRDFLYSLKSPSIRFDWGGVNAHLMEYTSLTIPYNLTYSDTFKKYFEARHHMDDRLPVGFWTSSIDRTSNISTDIIKYDNPRDKEALKSLAGYSGPVFVRRPDGCAYLANVELNNYSVAYNSEVIPVSFDITEIELTQEYMLPTGSYILDEDRQAIDALSVEPEGFYDSLLFELKAQ